MNEHGLKTSAGMMLSKYLRQVGQERTEVEGNDPASGESRIITKAEALARTMWKLALGYNEEERTVDPKSGRQMLRVKRYKPDNTMIALIFDRVEGKVASQENEKGKKQPLSSKVDEQAKRRVNALVGDSHGDTEAASS